MLAGMAGFLRVSLTSDLLCHSALSKGRASFWPAIFAAGGLPYIAGWRPRDNACWKAVAGIWIALHVPPNRSSRLHPPPILWRPAMGRLVASSLFFHSVPAPESWGFPWLRG
jgi:hypothetical protein